MQSDVSMFIFLPDDVTSNMTQLEESLTAEFVQDLSMTLLPSQVSLTLPVLRLSYSKDLLPLLDNLGETSTLQQIRLMVTYNLTHALEHWQMFSLFFWRRCLQKASKFVRQFIKGPKSPIFVPHSSPTLLLYLHGRSF